MGNHKFASYRRDRDAARKLYFEGMGSEEVKGASNLEEVLKIAGLDYKVSLEPTYLAGSTTPTPYYCTVKDDGMILGGGMSEKYGVCQNEDAFAIFESLINDGATVETAGHYRNYKKTYIQMNAGKDKLLDKDVDMYMLLVNDFSGTGGVRVHYTPVETWCSNCIAIARRNAVENLSVKHTSTVVDRLTIGTNLILSNRGYFDNIKKEAEALAAIKVSKSQVQNEVLPFIFNTMNIKEDSNRAETVRDTFMQAYNQVDVSNYGDSAWRVFEAVADMESHITPGRDTNNNAIYMERVLKGMVILTAVANMLPKRYATRTAIVT